MSSPVLMNQPAETASDTRDHIVFLCTGNAARSVMATVMMRDRSALYRVSGAGTMVLEGHPMSVRTRNALARHGHEDRNHRSRQLWVEDATSAVLIVAMSPEHVRWVREQYPAAAARTGLIKHVVHALAAAEGSDLAARIATLDLAAASIEDAAEVVDPAAGEQDIFDACSDELTVLIDQLIEALG